RPRAPARAGVYFWRRGTARGAALVVNPEVAESDLARMSAAQLAAQFAGGPVDVNAEEPKWLATVFAVGGRRALEGTLLVAAALLLVAEAAVTRAARDTSEEPD
ncbi:MAG: hypothetical protein U9Q74_15285, partial [Gemmatimonadota bacterium]|nr:hypothetical protein [Gemmatimonadota bacterium]